MSAVGDARQRPSAGWRLAAWPGRLIHALLRIGLVLLVAVLVGVSALAWRLAQGPLDVAWLARRIEAAAFPAGARTHLVIGAASVAWNGFQQGAEGGLELRLRDLRLDESRAPIARAAEVDATVSVLRLLQLRVVPRRIALTGLRLSAQRDAAGAVTVDLGGLDDATPRAAEPSDAPAPTLSDVMAELRRPAGGDGARSADGLRVLAQLQQVTVRDAKITLRDDVTGKTFGGELADLDLRRQGEGGVKGAASGQLVLGRAAAALRLTAALAPGGGTRVEATLDPVQAAPLAQSDPALAALGALDAAIQARATLDLSAALRPQAAELHVQTGGGRVAIDGFPLLIEKLALDATGRWDGDAWRPASVALQRAQLVLTSGKGGWPSTIGITGTAQRAGGELAAAVDLTLDHADFADLPALWPPALGRHVRPWMVENVSAGIARDGAFSLKLAGPEGDLSALALTEATGTLKGEDLTIHWLRPVPPIEHAQGVLTLISPEALEIAVPTATQGSIGLKDGLIRFTGLSQKDQFMTLTASLQGSVPEALQLLRHPRLKLLSAHPVPIKSSAGSIASTIKVDMPMKHELKPEQVGIAAQGRLTGLRLGGLVAGRDIDRGEIQFDVTQDGLQASGPAAVAGIVGTVEVGMDFRSGPPNQVIERASMLGRASPQQLAAAGLGTGGLLTSGQAGVSATYVSRRDGTSQVDAKADLTNAGLALLGWRKAPGPAAQASATIELRRDKLLGVERIDASGPGLSVTARAEMVGDRPLLLHLERVVLGPTRASGTIRFPAEAGEPTRVRVAGPSLDLSTQLGNLSGGSSDEDKGSWVVDARFDRVDLAKGAVLAGVTAHVEHDKTGLRALQFKSSGPEQVNAVLAPTEGGRRLSIRAADAGALLRAFDTIDTVRGGALVLEAQYDDRVPSSPLSGTIDMSEFDVSNAVFVGKFLQAITIYGIFDAVRGDGVHFTRLVLPFRYDRRQLHIGETRAYSSSLGLTATGWLDFSRNLMDIRGTVVPAYAINSALGRIPLIGRLFSPEKGGGLVAVDYVVNGKTGDPAIAVNPLSALTPGFLRGLFKIFS